MDLLHPTSATDLVCERFNVPRDVSISGRKALQLGWVTTANGRRLYAEIVFGSSFVTLDRIEDTNHVTSR